MLRKIRAAALAATVLMGSVGAALATDCSGSTTSASVNKSLSSARGFTIMNMSANMICIAFDVAASMGGTNCGSGSYPLQPGSSTAAGGSYSSPDSFRAGSFNIISTAGSDAYSCTRW